MWRTGEPHSLKGRLTSMRNADIMKTKIKIYRLFLI